MPGQIIKRKDKVIKICGSKKGAAEEFAFQSFAAKHGLAPECELEDSRITMPKLVPLQESDYIPPMKEVRLLIMRLHKMGICHRDIHEGNIVLDGKTPLLIDFEMATAVDPELPCYDLFGPTAKIPVPLIHQGTPFRNTGIWWDHGPRTRRSLKEIYGPHGLFNQPSNPFLR